MEKSVNIFKALSDNTRLRIVWLLKRAGTALCVCEIMDALHESQYNISRHLKELRIAGVVQDQKQGRWNFYTLADSSSQFEQLVLQAVAALTSDALELDYARLQRRLALREHDTCVIGVDSDLWRTIITEQFTPDESEKQGTLNGR
ncbi:hypothetical protein U27_03632 [Candidatus Vecturithrix granuli]|uniref:HTH arsR-type domain-containing protein n=1 Tax=Vecturithrix granuli TaxID=1499967 RepID=A0A081BWG4_VECG1|nr:hypothetical protein U27_03632 [Candidatus Vecturithrix granuli]